MATITVVTTKVVVMPTVLEVLGGVVSAVVASPAAPVIAGVAVVTGVTVAIGAIAASVISSSSSENSGGRGNTSSGPSKEDDDDEEKDKRKRRKKIVFDKNYNSDEESDEDSETVSLSDSESESSDDENLRGQTTTAWVLNALPDPLSRDQSLTAPPTGVQLMSLDPNGILPRRHLIRRTQMLFYGYGRLRKLCDYLGKNLRDICVFGTRRYIDYRRHVIRKPKSIHAAHIFSVSDLDFDLIIRKLNEKLQDERRTPDEIDEMLYDTINIFKNMMGQTEFVHCNYNQGGVGRAFDHFTREIMEGNYGALTLNNVEKVVEKIIERMRSARTDATRDEINEAIRVIEQLPSSYWVELYKQGYSGMLDKYYNQNKYDSCFLNKLTQINYTTWRSSNQ